MKKRVLFFIFVFSLFTTSLYAVTAKQMGIIINLAGKQRMLTQKMTKEALLVKLDIDTQKNIDLLKNDSALFDKTLNGLINGDEELSLVKVEEKNVQNQLKRVKELWVPFYKRVKKIINKNANDSDYSYLVKNNINLLKNMHQAVLLYVEVSKKVSKIKSDLAKDINIAGRQRMLTQKMAKDMVMIASNIEKQTAIKDLKETKKLFETSLNSLLQRVKLLNIKNQLLVVKKLWNKTKPYLNQKYATKKSVYKVVLALDKILIEMNKAVKMYENSAKRQILARSLSNIVKELIEQKNLKGLILNLSGRQRMLTQRITKDALLVATNNDKEYALKDLIFCAKLYNKTLNGFINGDKELKLVATKDPKIKEFLKEVKSDWNKFLKNIVKFVKTNDKEALKYIIANNEKMLKISNQLVQMYKHSTTSSKISPEMAQKVDLSGRQRMLSQKMLKEKLLIIYNINKAQNQVKLKKDIEDFDTVLHDLIYGSKKRNWSPEAITHILAQLKKVDSIWKKFKPLLENKNLKKSDLKTINKLNMKLLNEMDKAVKMYQEASDIYKDKLAKNRVRFF